jgi:hypothetical protein
MLRHVTRKYKFTYMFLSNNIQNSVSLSIKDMLNYPLKVDCNDSIAYLYRNGIFLLVTKNGYRKKIIINKWHIQKTNNPRSLLSLPTNLIVLIFRAYLFQWPFWGSSMKLLPTYPLPSPVVQSVFTLYLSSFFYKGKFITRAIGRGGGPENTDNL